MKAKKLIATGIATSMLLLALTGCGAGGNVFTFLMEYENYTFVEALKYLADQKRNADTF